MENVTRVILIYLLPVIRTTETNRKLQPTEKRTCGKWKLVREIGQGAYGIVYAATGPSGKRAAVKVCLKDSDNPEHYERELRGARLYRSVPSGDGLVRMIELGECDWGFYVAMELADDEFGVPPGKTCEYRPKTLSRVIAGEKALSLPAALELGVTLANGLVTLQRHHLLHRDVKPGNVIYVHGKPVLSDIGLLVEESEATSMVGTPGYVPPEKFTGASSDVYSLGLTLKAASFGRPVDELDKGPTLEADTAHPLFPVWWRILNKATHPDPSLRYHSAKALLKDLNTLRLREAKASASKPKSTIWLCLATILGLLILLCSIISLYNLHFYLTSGKS